MSLRNGNEYYPKPCGAEVYACNVGEMKCGSVEVRNRPERNGDEMERIYRKHMAIKLGIYLFSAQLMGGGVFCGFLILAKPKHSPIRCNKLTALPERRLVSFGVDSPQYEK